MNDGVSRCLPVDRDIWDTSLFNVRAQHVDESKVGAKRVAVRHNPFQDARGAWRSSVSCEMSGQEFFTRCP